MRLKIPLSRTAQTIAFRDIPRIVNSAAQQLRSKITDMPLWAIQPLSIQFDTTNQPCTLKCVYCNVQNRFIKETGNLPFKTIKHVAQCLNREKVRLDAAYPFMNSDPLLEPRLPTISKYLHKRLHCRILVSTNGVLYQNRELLRTPFIDDVYFTISASNPQTYQQIHKKPLFKQALLTLNWLRNHRFPNQIVGARFILLNDNSQDLPNWLNLFGNLPHEIRPLHHGKERAISTALNIANSTVDFYHKKQIEKFIKNEQPCNCLHNLAVSFDGKLMQCCDLPYNLNYGHVEEIDVLEVYRKRLDRGLDVEGCRTCNQKNPFWRELFEKYVW